MSKRLSILVALGLASAVLAGDGAIGYWEARGDAHMRAGRVPEALQAYETALGSSPEDQRLLQKYERAYVGSLMGSSQNTRPSYGLTRMGAPPRPTPPPPALDEEPPATDAAAASGEVTGPPDAGEEPAPTPEQGVRVRGDGVVEVDFRSLLSPVSRMTPPGAPRGGRGSGTGDGGGTAPDEEEDPGPAIYGAAETVQLGKVRQGFEGSRGQAVETENVIIRSAHYDITGVQVSYDSRGDLHIKGTITNTSPKIVRNPRVYCRIYDEAGVLRGRTFSYVSPGRNTLPSQKPKGFDILFRGYREPVASYQFEVIP